MQGLGLGEFGTVKLTTCIFVGCIFIDLYKYLYLYDNNSRSHSLPSSTNSRFNAWYCFRE